ncbi:MAG: amidohydrolase family protein [Desulfohalobiaceae bacterium]|nr:amidohydrolase family protein [Desulfohalobiaceae bacterium]
MKKNSFHDCIQVALGLDPADLVILNARLLNVFTGEFLPDQTISVKGRWIASVGSFPSDNMVGEKTEIIDASGGIVLPGLIDAHTHIFGQFFEPIDFLNRIIPSGITTLVTEIQEPAFISGKKGFFELTRILREQPLKVFFLAPPLLSISPHVAPLSLDSAVELLREEDVLGLGESYWQLVVNYPDMIKSVMLETLHRKKTLEGHAAGARSHKLNAYCSTGITSCHESISAAEVVERLRLGFRVMIREGSIRRDLERIALNLDFKEIDPRQLILVTDSVSPSDLLERGSLEFALQKAIDMGIDPVTAVRMVTLNPAEHFGIDSLVGGIAPGRHADMMIIPDPQTIQAEHVISQGSIIVRHREKLVGARQDRISKAYQNSVSLPEGGCSTSDFLIQAPSSEDNVQVRVIDQITELVTKEKIMHIPVINGYIHIDPDRDLLKVAAMDRMYNPGQKFLGLIRGIGLHYGAVASSATWDSTDIIVVGADEADMAVAVNRIHELQGGIVACSRGRVKAELSLPYFGLLPDIPTEAVVNQLEELRSELRQMGVQLEEPWLTINVLTCAAIPFFRICESGLIDFQDMTPKALCIV